MQKLQGTGGGGGPDSPGQEAQRGPASEGGQESFVAERLFSGVGLQVEEWAEVLGAPRIALRNLSCRSGGAPHCLAGSVGVVTPGAAAPDFCSGGFRKSPRQMPQPKSRSLREQRRLAEPPSRKVPVPLTGGARPLQNLLQGASGLERGAGAKRL